MQLTMVRWVWHDRSGSASGNGTDREEGLSRQATRVPGWQPGLNGVEEESELAASAEGSQRETGLG